jgi:hypothetical protein
MKKIFVFVLAAIALTACQQTKSTTEETTVTEQTTTAAPSPDAAVMSFEQGMYNFGKITQGDKVHYDFKFKNTGKSPLIITDATATCGCTVPEIPKEPVKPGESSMIKVVFNSTGKIGMQDKVVTITSNGNPSTTEVHLIGEVAEPAAKL